MRLNYTHASKMKKMLTRSFWNLKMTLESLLQRMMLRWLYRECMECLGSLLTCSKKLMLMKMHQGQRRKKKLNAHYSMIKIEESLKMADL